METAGLRSGVSELSQLGQLHEENGRLKRLVADLSMNRQILREIISKKLQGLVRFVSWRACRQEPDALVQLSQGTASAS